MSLKRLANSGDEPTGPVERDIMLIWPAKYMNITSMHYMVACIDKSGSHKVQHVTTECSIHYECKYTTILIIPRW